MHDVSVCISVYTEYQMRFLVKALLLISFFMLLTEREEAAVEIPEGNTTAGADVDKRVKRRLLMGKKCLSKIIWLFAQTSYVEELFFNVTIVVLD